MKELTLINEIRKRSGRPGKGVLTGIGDDCAVLEGRGKDHFLWGADMLVENTHFRKEDDLYGVGWKAVAVNISDIAAMGGTPRYITVSIGVPPRVKMPSIRRLYSGILAVCRRYGVSLVGGDTNRSAVLVIDVSILGVVKKEHLVRRSGARDKDLVLITGPVADGRARHLDFCPRLEEARFLVSRFEVSSMIDTSDGIAMDIGRICSESRAGCRLYAGAIPLSKGLSLHDALYYGESFELLFTMSAAEARRLFKAKAPAARKARFFVIGEITPPAEGMFILRQEGRAERLRAKGFEHL